MATTIMDKTVKPINPDSIGQPSVNGQEMDIYDIIGQHMASKLATSQAPTDMSAIAAALGSGAAVNTPMGLSPDALFGLMPEQVTSVANTRADIGYKKMLENIGALDFTQKLQGTQENRALTDKIVLGEQERKKQLEITNMSKQMNEHMVKIQADAQKDPIKMQQLSIFNRMKNGDQTVTPIEKELAGELFKSQFNPKDALNFIQTAPMLVGAGLMDPITAKTTIDLMQPIINRAAKDFLSDKKGGKKDYGPAIATDPLGKAVYKDGSNYVYEDGTIYTPKKGK